MPKVEIGRIPGTGKIALDQEFGTLEVNPYPVVQVYPPTGLSPNIDGDPQLSYGEALFDGHAAVEYRREVSRDREEERGQRPKWDVKVEFPWTGDQFPERSVLHVHLHEGEVEIYRVTESHANGVRAILRGVRG